jgi:nuclear transport factor 2 (NTF2) superfamily protein
MRLTASLIGQTRKTSAHQQTKVLYHNDPQQLRLNMPDGHPLLPPFNSETATQKVRAAENGWNSCDPERVSLVWQFLAEPDGFITGRSEIIAFLTRKWSREIEYRLIKELWAFTGNRIAVRFSYEWHDDSGNWFRSYGNENWALTHDALPGPVLWMALIVNQRASVFVRNASIWTRVLLRRSAIIVSKSSILCRLVRIPMVLVRKCHPLFQ